MRIKKMYQGTVPENKILDTYSTSATDTYSCNYVNGLETYSTSETRVGTWIDGKPIYRKTFTIPSFSINEISVNTGLTTISNIVNWKGCFKRADINCLYSIDNALMDEWRFNYNTGIMIFKTNNRYATFTGYITIEYTKTTD